MDHAIAALHGHATMLSRFATLARAARSAASAARPAASTAAASSTEAASQSHHGFAAMGFTSVALLGLGSIALTDEAEHGLAPAQYAWPHEGLFSSYDHSGIRRGHQVYQQVPFRTHRTFAHSRFPPPSFWVWKFSAALYRYAECPPMAGRRAPFIDGATRARRNGAFARERPQSGWLCSALLKLRKPSPCR